MPSKKALRLAAIALFCFSSVTAAAPAMAETAVQGSQTSGGAEAGGGESTASNTNGFSNGPSGSGASGANSSQVGSNSSNTSQSGKAKSGDAVAGGQVTGVVADNATVQNQNSSDGATSTVGTASVNNNSAGSSGANASTDLGGGPAQASQFGHNTNSISQEAVVATGDAVAGSQVTGIVGGGDHTIQNQNDSTGATATAADAFASNIAFANAGAFADSPDDIAQASQLGDNASAVAQSIDASTGDAVAGSQIAGVVGGSAEVQQQNSSTDAFAEQAAILAFNTADSLSGPIASSFGDTASAQQSGDNASALSQAITASLGDAVAGSQVTGGVGTGEFTVQNQNDATGAAANSLEVAPLVLASNTGSVDAGPAAVADGSPSGAAGQVGDNFTAADQSIAVDGGDAVAGSQITGAVGFDDVTVQNQNSGGDAFATGSDVLAVNELAAFTGPRVVGDELDPAVAQASQVGDNDSALAQDLRVDGGDAVAASSVVGVVADGGDVTIQASNSGTGDATSGDLIGTNSAVSDTGPAAFGTETGQASQSGDNSSALAQDAVIGGGDALAGAQVFGVVNDGPGGTVTIQGQNDSEGSLATSGTVLGLNIATENATGPIATGSDTASASQVGDNDAAISQGLTASAGDAVAGGQVAGIVAGSGADVDVQLQNSSTGDTAVTGTVNGVNVMDAAVGPIALNEGTAQASQVGDDTLAYAQHVSVTGGDAVAGSQVVGLVGGDDNDIQTQNDADDPSATSLEASALNAAGGNVGPLASGDTASTQQSGDTDIDGEQGLDTTSGDAVAGGQISGIVGAA